MSIVVKIDMPKNCSECPIFCSVRETEFKDSCPIIAELPKEHNEFVELPSVISWNRDRLPKYEDRFDNGVEWILEKLDAQEFKIPAEYDDENK